MAVMAKTKKVSTEKKSSSHPPYAEMIKEAIAALKERSGSSQIAITKFISEKHKSANLSPNYKKFLLSQLKRLVASGSLIKVKNSFKLCPEKPIKTQKKAPKKVKVGAISTPVKAKAKAKKVTPKIAKKVTPKKAKKVIKKVKSIKSPGKKPLAAKKVAKK